jgi:hypothetical protein
VDSACPEQARFRDLHELPADYFDSDAAELRRPHRRLRILFVYDSVSVAVERVNLTAGISGDPLAVP